MAANRPAFQPSPATPLTEASLTQTRRPAARLSDQKASRGFAAMDPALQLQISVAGGKASHSSGKAHQWTKQEAQEAGRKGGLISRRRGSGQRQLNVQLEAWEKALVETVAVARGEVAPSALLRLLVVEEARRLGIEVQPA